MDQNNFFNYDTALSDKIADNKHKKILLHKNIINCDLSIDGHTIKTQCAFFPESLITVIIFPGSPSVLAECNIKNNLNHIATHSQIDTEDVMHSYIIDDVFRYCFYNKITVLRYNSIDIASSNTTNSKNKISDTPSFIQGTACFNYLCSLYEEQELNIPPIVVVGFDEGSAIGLELLLRRPEIRASLSISPPVHCYNLSHNLYQNNSKILGILYGKHDQLASNAQMLQYSDDLKQKNLHVIYYVTQTDRYIGNTNILLFNVNNFFNYVMQRITQDPIQEN